MPCFLLFCSVLRFDLYRRGILPHIGRGVFVQCMITTTNILNKYNLKHDLIRTNIQCGRNIYIIITYHNSIMHAFKLYLNCIWPQIVFLTWNYVSFYSSISKNKNHLHGRVLVLIRKKWKFTFSYPYYYCYRFKCKDIRNIYFHTISAK